MTHSHLSAALEQVVSTRCQNCAGPLCRCALVLLQPPTRHTCLLLLCEGLHPGSQDAVQVVVLVRHEEHATAADGGWGCELEAVALEDEVDVVGKLDALPRRHGQQPGSQKTSKCQPGLPAAWLPEVMISSLAASHGQHSGQTSAAF